MCVYAACQEYTLNAHIKNFHILTDNKGWKCDQCKFVTCYKDKLPIHIKAVHDKIRDFQCTQCTYASSRKDGLALHVRTVHNKKKDHKCDLCDYATSDKLPSL